MQVWSAELKDIEKLYEQLKGMIPGLEKELAPLIKTDDSNVIMLYSRRCLEVIITDLCESELKRQRKTEPLKGIIDKLSKEGKVPAYILTSMDGLNSLSTFGAHPKDYDPDQVRPVLINLATILKWYMKFTNKGVEQKSSDADKPIEPGLFVDYRGPINTSTINEILSSLKKSYEYKILDKTTAKRLYAIVVECLENISKYSLIKEGKKDTGEPYISVRKKNNEILVTSRNPVSDDKLTSLDKKLKQINELDSDTLKTLYDERIKQEIRPEHTGAGLGFILIALKSGNKIDFRFMKDKDECYFLELKIHITESVGKNLFIEGTINSPAVVFDPDRKVFEISGESRPDDVPGFYGILLKWLDEFGLKLRVTEESHEPVVFNFNLEYYNSLSAKYILEFCLKLSLMNYEGTNASARWHYEEDDLDMLEAGKELSKITKLPFEFVIKN